MLRTITSKSLVAYSQCGHKAFLTHCANEKGIVNEYDRIVQQNKLDNQKEYLNTLNAKNINILPYTRDHFRAKNNYLANALLKTRGLEAECGLLEKHQSAQSFSYLPTIFAGTHNITKEHRLELLFAGYVLSKLQRSPPEIGKIISLGHKIITLKLNNCFKAIRPILNQLQEWDAVPNPDPPLIILNRHCPYCQFQTSCKTKAEKENNLSLLDGISTLKFINKYKRKGIFTVNQLSYLYRPRRQRKRSRTPRSMKHSVELQALVIRTGSIYLRESPTLSRHHTELFLDIEGIPDRQSFYLIGLLICKQDSSTYYPFWTDTDEDEADIWRQFIEILDKYSDCPIFHYGHYDAKAIAKLGKRYQTEIEGISKQLVNLNTLIPR